MKPSLEVAAGSELENQLKVLNLKREDLAIAQVLEPYIKENIVGIVNNFYKNIAHHPPLIDIINKNSSIDRLKQSLQTHISEMFSGEINEHFLLKRKKIATIHVKVGLTQKWYISSFQEIYDSMMNVIYDVFTCEQDRQLAMGTIYKLLNLEEQIVLEAYDEELMSLKEKETEYQKSIIQSIEKTSLDLASLAGKTTSFIEEMTTQIDMATESSKIGTKMAGEAEMVSNKGRIYLNDMTASLSGLESGTITVNEKMASLVETSEEIKSIVAIVQSIAQQTNLLSLNASIEAARSGEHGRGFAVVANEIGELAQQTEASVMNVTNLVNETNNQVNESATSLQEVKKYLSDVQEQMKNMELAFQAINEQMNRTKDTNFEIQRDLENMEDVTDNIVKVASSTSESAEQLKMLLD